MMGTEYKSTKSRSIFIAGLEHNKAYLLCTGEASTNSKVIKEIERIRVGCYDLSTVEWVARQLASMY